MAKVFGPAQESLEKVKNSDLPEKQKTALITAFGLMLECPAGKVTMGNQKEKSIWNYLGFGEETEEGKYEYELKTFGLHKYQVTKGFYYSVFEGKELLEYYLNMPMDYVDWAQAKAFCDKLNELAEGYLPESYHFDLPTEFQWEYACKAGVEAHFNNNTNFEEKKGKFAGLEEVGWYLENSDEKPHHVGLKKPNNWGLYDMHGNVWEWCRNWYYDSLANYDASKQDSVTGNRHAARGGSYTSVVARCRSGKRGNFNSEVAGPRIGFRIALVAE